MINIRINDRLYHFPSLWDELSAEDILFFSHKMVIREPVSTIKPALTLKILNLKVLKKESETDGELEYFYMKDSQGKAFLISAYALQLVSEKLDFMFAEKSIKEGKKQCYVHSRLTKNPVPELRVGKTVFDGPNQALSDITFHRFILSEHYYSLLVKSGDPVLLDKILGVLYIEEGESFSEDKWLLNHTRFKNVSQVEKYAIRLYYEGSKSFLSDKFPFVFGRKKSSRLSVVDGFMKIVNSLSGNDVTKHDKIRASPLYEVLYSLNDLIEKNEKL